jgi:hypothetical protein
LILKREQVTGPNPTKEEEEEEKEYRKIIDE